MIKLTEIQQEYLKTSMSVVSVLIKQSEDLEQQIEDKREEIKGYYRKALDFVARDMGQNPFPDGTVVLKGEEGELYLEKPPCDSEEE